MIDFPEDDLYDVNLICADLELHWSLRSRLPERFFQDRYNVGIWAWELPHFPEKWYDRFAFYDEIWVASSFIANALTPVAPLPVVQIPPVLTVAAPGSRQEGRRRLNVGQADFVFLFVFDFYSRVQRKNPLAVIEAFKRAFAPGEPVRLVIKCINADFDRETFEAMTVSAAGYPVSVYDGYWSRRKMTDLMAACDAYVSLHRAEGTGLTVTEAMALGKPVVATGWSGNMDFMTPFNSYPVAYKLVTLQETVGLYAAGETWAEPSVEHAAQLMRLVFVNREEAEARGERARRDLETLYSEERVAALISSRLKVITKNDRFAALKDALRAPDMDPAAVLSQFDDLGQYLPRKQLCYIQLLDRLRATADTILPVGVTVAVVSRGDPELMRLGARRACHFMQDSDGGYAGYNPADSAEAINRLEALRAQGVAYLLLPQTSFWWLEHYVDFRRYLENSYPRRLQTHDCVVFDLTKAFTENSSLLGKAT